MNPYTGETTPLKFDLDDHKALRPLPESLLGQVEQAAKEIDCAVEDLVLVTGKKEHIERVSNAIKAQNRAKNKRARKSRKANRK